MSTAEVDFPEGTADNVIKSLTDALTQVREIADFLDSTGHGLGTDCVRELYRVAKEKLGHAHRLCMVGAAAAEGGEVPSPPYFDDIDVDPGDYANGFDAGRCTERRKVLDYVAAQAETDRGKPHSVGQIGALLLALEEGRHVTVTGPSMSTSEEPKDG